MEITHYKYPHPRKPYQFPHYVSHAHTSSCLSVHPLPKLLPSFVSSHQGKEMSRAFSTAARALKSLTWSNKGTTQDVSWVKSYAENAVDLVPQLLDKVDSGTVQGDPHPTPRNNDPLHASITLAKGDSCVTSAHVYPDGTVVFSKAIYGRVRVSRVSEAPEGSGPAQ